MEHFPKNKSQYRKFVNRMISDMDNYQFFNLIGLGLEDGDEIDDYINTSEEKILKPEIRIYDNPQTLTYETSIHTNFFRDYYLTMSNIDRSDYYNIKFQKKPLMIWIWISVVMISVGGFLRVLRNVINSLSSKDFLICPLNNSAIFFLFKKKFSICCNLFLNKSITSFIINSCPLNVL